MAEEPLVLWDQQAAKRVVDAVRKVEQTQIDVPVTANRYVFYTLSAATITATEQYVYAEIWDVPASQKLQAKAKVRFRDFALSQVKAGELGFCARVGDDFFYDTQEAQRCFVLLADATNDLTWAVETDLGGVVRGVNFQVKNWKGLLDGAKAGYEGIASLTNGAWVGTGPCTDKSCVTAATITVPSDASVLMNTAYNANVAFSGLSGAPSASNLPPGLSFNPANGNITGTPTASGRYLITVTGSGPKTGAPTVNCPLTAIYVLTVLEP